MYERKDRHDGRRVMTELRSPYWLWLYRRGIHVYVHDSADLRSRHQHQAYASSNIDKTGEERDGVKRLDKHVLRSIMVFFIRTYAVTMLMSLNTSKHAFYAR